MTRFQGILLALALTLSILSFSAVANVKMGNAFSDKMVLQRGMPVPVWGQAKAGERVKVSFADQTVETTAGENGHWMVKLQPLKASSENRSMSIEGTSTVTIEDVMVGEVWLASGQSNMADRFKVYGHEEFPEEYVDMDLSRFRFSTRDGWYEASKENQKKLSRVAFYFGIELYQKLGVPIGLITRYYGGTPIQAWMPQETAQKTRLSLNIPSDWNEEDKAPRQPGAQYERAIKPVIPYAMRGAVWYQGERNAKTQTGYEYDVLLKTLVETWRDLWAERADLPRRNFPFYYVQVPVRDKNAEFPWLRDRMRRALDMIDNSGMAVFCDYGGPAYHPPEKQPAGYRLALLALANDYGYTDLVYSGPLLEDVRFNGDKALLTFSHVGEGLKSKSAEKKLQFFKIAGEDGQYVPAKARIAGKNTVEVESPKVSNPTDVRYMFRQGMPEVSLVNSAGIPASPFMTDDSEPNR